MAPFHAWVRPDALEVVIAVAVGFTELCWGPNISCGQSLETVATWVALEVWAAVAVELTDPTAAVAPPAVIIAPAAIMAANRKRVIALLNTG